MRKHLKVSAKPVATLPYLVPPTDDEIDKLEIEASWEPIMERTTFPSDEFFNRIEEWKWDIEYHNYEIEAFDHYDAERNLPRRRHRHFNGLFHDWFDDLVFNPYLDHDMYYPDDPYHDFDRAFLQEDEEDHLHEIVSYDIEIPAYQEKLEQLQEIDPETELMRTIPLRGLPYQARQEVLSLYG